MKFCKLLMGSCNQLLFILFSLSLYSPIYLEKNIRHSLVGNYEYSVAVRYGTTGGGVEKSCFGTIRYGTPSFNTVRDGTVPILTEAVGGTTRC